MCSRKLHARLRRVHGDRAVDQALALCKRSAMPSPSHRESRKEGRSFSRTSYWRNVSAFAVRLMADTISFAQHNVRFTPQSGHVRCN